MKRGHQHTLRETSSAWGGVRGLAGTTVQTEKWESAGNQSILSAVYEWRRNHTLHPTWPRGLSSYSLLFKCSPTTKNLVILIWFLHISFLKNFRFSAGKSQLWHWVVVPARHATSTQASGPIRQPYAGVNYLTPLILIYPWSRAVSLAPSCSFATLMIFGPLQAFFQYCSPTIRPVLEREKTEAVTFFLISLFIRNSIYT